MIQNQIAEWLGKGYRSYEIGFARTHSFQAPDDDCVRAWLDGWDAAKQDHEGDDR